MADVRFTKVRKSYGALDIIPELDLYIPDGSFTVLVGPSGCGKSTLLRTIAWLEEVSSGQITIGGEDVIWRDPSERGVAMVFQSYALYPHMTVRDNIGFGLKLSGMPKDEVAPRVDDAASVLQLTKLLDRKPKALSGGQRQRVAIGRAIVRQPKVFLSDEPLSNLDVSLRGQMRVELAELHARIGATMVYVTHDQVEAMTLADQIGVQNAGRIEQVGAPMDLYRAPATPFVAGFIGSPTMNFVKGSAAHGLGGDKVGIRPEHLDLSLTSGLWTGRLRHVGHLGAETLCHVEVPGIGQIVVKTAGDLALAAGQAVHETPRRDHLHIFGAGMRAA